MSRENMLKIKTQLYPVFQHEVQNHSGFSQYKIGLEKQSPWQPTVLFNEHAVHKVGLSKALLYAYKSKNEITANKTMG